METSDVVKALGEVPRFAPGDRVKVSVRYPIGHYRVPVYLRGKSATVEAVIHPTMVDNEEEGFGRNSGIKGFYYRIGMPLDTLWPDYRGSPKDSLRIEVFETWLEVER